jgi:hypothetical protein
MQPRKATGLRILNGLSGPGRPSKRSKRVVTELLDAISAGAPIILACQAAGIHPDTFQVWRRRDSRLALQTDQAAARGALKRLKKIEEHGEENFAALSWMLEPRYPEMFGKPEVQLNVGIQNNVNGNDKKNFEIIVVEDLEFLGLRQRSEYTHYPGPDRVVREVEANVVRPPVAPELSGHLSREGAPEGKVISRSAHEENERRSALLTAEVNKLLGLQHSTEETPTNPATPQDGL